METNKITGRVKWFNPIKGFGFIVTDSPGPDVLLHINVLRNFGQGTVSEGSLIEFVAQESAKGKQVAEIVSIEPPDEEAEGETRYRETGASNILSGGWRDSDSRRHDTRYQPRNREPRQQYDMPEPTGDFFPARVKWFDKLRGFGFVNIYGSASDVFVHMQVLRFSNLVDLQAGEAISVRISDGPRGKMVSQIRPWESVRSSDHEQHEHFEGVSEQ